MNKTELNWKNIVEGSWKNFVFIKIKPDNYAEVCEFVKRDFLIDEPGAKLGGYTEEYAEEYCNLLKIFMGHNISFMARDKESGEIAGLRISWYHKKDDQTLRVEKTDPLVHSLSYAVMIRILEQLEKNAGNIFEKFGVDLYIEFFMNSVARKYRRLGLAEEMYRRMLHFLEEENDKLVICRFSSPYSRAAARNCGFKPLARWDYSEFVDDNGENIFEDFDIDPEIMFMTIEFKALAQKSKI